MMKKLLSALLIVALCLSLPMLVLAEGYTVDGDGNATYESAVGFTFKIDDVNGEITGEDSTVVTTSVGVMGIGSKWATWFSAEKVGDGVYKVITDGTAMGGTALDMTLSDGQILVVVHSSSSRPSEADKYPNWESKVAARAVKAGDYIVFSDGLNLDEGSGSGYAKVVTEFEANAGTVTFPELPDESTEAPDESAPTESESVSEPAYENTDTPDKTESESETILIPLGDRNNGSLGWLWITLGVIFLCVGVVVLVLIIVWKPKK